jgi:hypothetical protein
MAGWRSKRPNALKHGVFAKTAILPGEDPEEFQELHSALVEEWNPMGPTEEDAVLSIAKGVWRKRRIQKFLEVEVMASEINPSHSGYNEVVALRFFARYFEKNSDEGFAEYDRILARLLSVERFNELKRKLPRETFGSASEWAQAVKNEITSVLLPAIGEPPDKMLIVLSAATLSQELFKLELTLDERLDAMIDRAIKRLIQTKAMKQMLDHTSRTGRDDEPRKIQNRKPDGASAR